VHIIPTAVLSNNYHGSYKDTISRVQFFEASGLIYQQIFIDTDNPECVLNGVKTSIAPRFLIEYTLFPNVVMALRRAFPGALIFVRAHNLEPMQHLDNYGWWPPQGPLWMLYGMSRLFMGDITIKKHATAIWTISDWEKRCYFTKLPGSARVDWMPYHCPSHLLPQECNSIDGRKKIVCLPTFHKNRKSLDLVMNFIRFAEKLYARVGDTYDFIVTGAARDWGLPQPACIQYAGVIDDIRSLLSSSKAVALLSGMGYGFKTTIGDAIAHGALVLAHPNVVRRCSVEIAENVIPVNSAIDADIDHAAERLQSENVSSNIDEQFRAGAEQQLTDAFLNH